MENSRAPHRSPAASGGKQPRISNYDCSAAIIQIRVKSFSTKRINIFLSLRPRAHFFLRIFQTIKLLRFSASSGPNARAKRAVKAKAQLTLTATLFSAHFRMVRKMCLCEAGARWEALFACEENTRILSDLMASRWRNGELYFVTVQMSLSGSSVSHLSECSWATLAPALDSGPALG